MNRTSLSQSLEFSQMQAEAQRRHAAGDALGAMSICLKLVKAKPNDTNLLALLGETLTAMGRTEEARGSLTKALRLRRDDPALLYDLAMTYRREGQFDQAHQYLDKALKVRPDDPTIVSAKSACFYIAGDIDAAAATLAPLLDHGDRHISVVLGFARICHRLKREADGVALLHDALSQPDLPGKTRSDILFLLGELHDRMGHYDLAFEAFAKANQLRGARFDPKSYSELVDDLIHRTWTAPRMKQLPRATIPPPRSEKPVFIVGMPRSGTSLVEQILASHPDVYGAGELNDIGKLVHDWQGSLGGAISLMTDLEPLTQQCVDREARQYLDAITRLAVAGGRPKAKRVTDKMPLNFRHLGLISLLFPHAKIIHCIRDPMDTCLSCHFHSFAGQNPYTTNLTHLGLFYRDYQRIMRHWHDVLDVPGAGAGLGAILDVVYEELVADQEAWSRRLIEFIGLEWNDACLRFHENKRVVLTLSNDQVRRPMYSSSVGRWRKYEKHLGPLKDALDVG